MNQKFLPPRAPPRIPRKSSRPVRVLAQRVSQASVTVGGKIISQVGHGLLILLGVEVSDTQDDADWLAGKLSKLRVFSDDKGLMNLSIQEIDGQLLVVSQFTLYASTAKGNRPSYIRSARPEQAAPLYKYFIQSLETQSLRKVQAGEFGADMQVNLINDGPVTIWIDSRQRE